MKQKVDRIFRQRSKCHGMPLAARQVLDDCRYSLKQLEKAQSEQSWRVMWVAAVVLLRSVGHVLRKVDCEKDTGLATTCSAKFAEWKGSSETHRIFRDFIEHERNNVIKQYEFGYLQGQATVTVTIEGRVTEKFDLSPELYRPILGGSYNTEDAREVLENAIVWWEQQLTELEKANPLPPTSMTLST